MSDDEESIHHSAREAFTSPFMSMDAPKISGLKSQANKWWSGNPGVGEGGPGLASSLWESTKDAASGAWDLGKSAYKWTVGLMNGDTIREALTGEDAKPGERSEAQGRTKDADKPWFMKEKDEREAAKPGKRTGAQEKSWAELEREKFDRDWDKEIAKKAKRDARETAKEPKDTKSGIGADGKPVQRAPGDTGYVKPQRFEKEGAAPTPAERKVLDRIEKEFTGQAQSEKKKNAAPTPAERKVLETASKETSAREAAKSPAGLSAAAPSKAPENELEKRVQANIAANGPKPAAPDKMSDAELGQKLQAILHPAEPERSAKAEPTPAPKSSEPAKLQSAANQPTPGATSPTTIGRTTPESPVKMTVGAKQSTVGRTSADLGQSSRLTVLHDNHPAPKPGQPAQVPGAEHGAQAHDTPREAAVHPKDAPHAAAARPAHRQAAGTRVAEPMHRGPGAAPTGAAAQPVHGGAPATVTTPQAAQPVAMSDKSKGATAASGDAGKEKSVLSKDSGVLTGKAELVMNGMPVGELNLNLRRA